MTVAHILLEIRNTRDFGTDMLCMLYPIVNKSRAIPLHLLGTDKYETSDAHIHMLVNIPV